MSPLYEVQRASTEAAALGESPLWHPREQCLYFVDIPRCQVLRLGAGGAIDARWQLDSEPGCIAALDTGGLLVAQRSGLWRLDTASGAQQRIADAPYDSGAQRFNDGKAEALGRLWVGTIDDARAPAAALFRYAGQRFERLADGITTSNGLAWGPDQTRLYWSDTKAHEIYAFDFDAVRGAITHRRVFARFEPRRADQALASYGGRPDGAAVDAAGNYWVAMYEGQRLLQLAPDGTLLRAVALPVRCPTMPCFGGADLRTLYITTASDKRPADELAAQPWAGCVLQLRVETPGLPAQFARLA
jgi:sugar lactone lactonase YvrE